MSIYCKNNLYTLYLGKMQEELDNLEDNSVDSIVTDPPYELNFMNKGWDNSGVAFQKDTWEKCLRVLKPGGYLLAFGGSRTYHRIACAIEDAGFEIRDTIMWLYGSGFPKSMDISKQLDKKPYCKEREELKKYIQEYINKSSKTRKQIDDECGFTACSYTRLSYRQDDGWGSAIPNEEKWNIMKKVLGFDDKWDWYIKEAEREVIGKKESGCFNSQEKDRYTIGSSKSLEVDITIPSTDLAKQWKGWGTCLKPAYEPIVVARKPFDGSLVNNVLEYGVGGLNIDECRVPAKQGEYDIRHYTKEDCFQNLKPKKSKFQVEPQPEGRFPANIITDGSDEVAKGFPYTKSTGGSGEASKKNTFANTYNGGCGHDMNCANLGGLGDEGSAMRYFYVAKEGEKDNDDIPKTVGRFPSNVVLDGSEEVTSGFPVRETQNGSITKRYKMNNQVYGEYGYCNTLDAYQDSGSASRYYYCAKASKKDRDEGLDEFEEKKTGELQGGRKEGSAGSLRVRADGSIGENPFAGNGAPKRNTHPTVKPTELMQYLVRLVSPKGATILDPFMGSGSTGKACMIENTERNANYKFIGIEMTEEYLPIADARIRYWVDREIEEEVKEDVEPVKKEDVVKLW